MLLERLRDGSLGVRFNVGDDFQRVAEGERQAQLERAADDTFWVLSFTPMRLGLLPEHDDVLRSDVERQRRCEFQQQYAALASDMGSDRRPPRTDDAHWSPLIELDRTLLDGAPVLRVLSRRAYEQGLEIIEGNLLVPVASGTFLVHVRHTAQLTGFRETALYEVAMRKEPERPLAEMMARHRQQYFDDPSWDAGFPTHGLSVVRAALSWLMDPERGGLRVPQPLPMPPAGEAILSDLGCAITPLPRYTQTPAHEMGLGDNLVMFTRMTCGDALMLDVWRTPDVLSSRAGRAEALAEAARKNALEWAQQGATDIEMDTRILPELEGRPLVANEVRFTFGGRAKVSSTRWLADADGAVFRVTVGGPSCLSRDELSAEADAVVRSWRRLPGEAARPVAPSRKPWWKLW